NHGLVYKAGQIQEALGNDDKALDYFLEADQYLDSPLEVKLKIARIYFLKKKVIKADDYLSRVLRMDPTNKEALTMRRSM
ncbi:MAG: response regulator, partial [Desulfobacteraceae bacterium]|nr:response regulator [Desulfobacteraceae bacterium]